MNRKTITPTSTQTSLAWSLQAERGPDCIFVKLSNNGVGEVCDADRISDSITEMMTRHLTSRVVVELDHLETVPDNVCREMERLSVWVTQHGGLLRFAGDSIDFERKMQSRHPEMQLFISRENALLGRRPK